MNLKHDFLILFLFDLMMLLIVLVQIKQVQIFTSKADKILKIDKADPNQNMIILMKFKDLSILIL